MPLPFSLNFKWNSNWFLKLLILQLWWCLTILNNNQFGSHFKSNALGMGINVFFLFFKLFFFCLNYYYHHYFLLLLLNRFVILKLLREVTQGSPMLQSHLTRRRHSTSILPRPPPQVHYPLSQLNKNSHWQYIYNIIRIKKHKFHRAQSLHPFDLIGITYRIF